MTIAPTSISLDYSLGSNGVFDIASNTDWSITDDSGWLDVTPLSGVNDAAITVTANSANTGITSRAATVTITGSGVSNKTITVTQAPTPSVEKTLGNTEVYTDYSTVANRRAIPVTFGDDGTITSISIYHNGGTGDVLLGVYTDQSGSPSSLLGSTASTAINPTSGWQTVSLEVQLL